MDGLATIYDQHRRAAEARDALKQSLEKEWAKRHALQAEQHRAAEEFSKVRTEVEDLRRARAAIKDKYEEAVAEYATASKNCAAFDQDYFHGKAELSSEDYFEAIWAQTGLAAKLDTLRWDHLRALEQERAKEEEFKTVGADLAVKTSDHSEIANEISRIRARLREADATAACAKRNYEEAASYIRES